MKILVCVLIGYLVGSLNPAALISHLKHKDLRKTGTGNLGATNVLLAFGKRCGAFVMLFDITKAFVTVTLVELLVPDISWIGIATGTCVIIGHCFPFYLGFKGGKGLAAFAGLVLAYQPLLFVFLLITGVAFMLIVNYSFILPFYATVFFAIYVAITEKTLAMTVCATVVSAIIFAMHFGNLIKAIKGQDNKIREYIKNKMFKKSNAK